MVSLMLIMIAIATGGMEYELRGWRGTRYA